MSDIWITVYPNATRQPTMAKLTFREEEFGDEGESREVMNEPEIIGSRYAIDLALGRIAFHQAKRRKGGA